MPTINISTLKLTINVQAPTPAPEVAEDPHTSSFAAPAALFGAVQQPADADADAPEGNGQTAATRFVQGDHVRIATSVDEAPAAAEPQQAPGAVTPAQVVDFLQSDPRYSWRTAQAVAKHFGLSESDAEQLLGGAVAHDKAEMCHRRADDVKLYRAL